MMIQIFVLVVVFVSLLTEKNYKTSPRFSKIIQDTPLNEIPKESKQE